MPTPTKYTFSIASDFPGASVNSTKLHTEIVASSIVTALDRVDTSGDVLYVWFKDALSITDRTTLDNNAVGPAGGLIAAHDNTPSISIRKVALAHKLTDDNRIRVAIEKSNGLGKDFYSHNWADPTSWYTDSTRAVDEIATDSGDLLTYNLININIIDVYHGKVTGEDDLLDASSNSYRIVVKVNDLAKVEQDPHTDSGGDFIINYTDGTVTFLSALTAPDVVKATYYYANSSVFKIIPAAGKKLAIEVVEIQFTDDVVITDTVSFITYGFVDVFAPSLVNNPYPPGTKIPIKTFKYKSMKDYQNAAFKSYVTYPALGGMGWRGMAKPVIVFDWDYQRGLTLSSAYGMESHLVLEHDVPLGGTWATATVYCGEDIE